MKKIIKEFKTFISKGNVVDLAVAFIIGAAFKAIVTSLVSDIIMPVVSLVVGEQGFSNYKYIITEADEAAGIAENAIYYGSFIQNIIDFFIIAVVVFFMVRAINHIKEAFDNDQVEEVKAPPKPKTEDILLDIKQILETQQAK